MEAHEVCQSGYENVTNHDRSMRSLGCDCEIGANNHVVAEAKRIARVREALPACSRRGWFKAVDLLFSLPRARNRVQSGLLRAISRDTFGQHEHDYRT